MSELQIVVTDAGYQAAVNNVPTKQGFSILLARADIYDNTNRKRQTVNVEGRAIAGNQIHLRCTVSDTQTYFIKYIDLIDGISNKVFARISKTDGSNIDVVNPVKKAVVVVAFKLSSLPNNTVTITESSNDYFAGLLDNHIVDRNAHSELFNLKADKTALAAAIASIGANKTAADNAIALKADKATQFTAGAGLTGGGTLGGNRTLSMGTPSKITERSTNTAVSDTHSHEIDKASTTVMGIVKLSSATNSAAENLAATPKAIKTVSDALNNLDGRSLKQRGALSSRNLNDLKGEANYGVWNQTANAAATTERNYPTTKAGTLLALPSAYEGQQIYLPLDQNYLYKRHTNQSGGWGAWHIVGEVIDSPNNTSVSAAASANQVKRLNDRAANIENTKLGNRGNQTITDGSLTVGVRNHWTKAMYPSGNGKWIFEAHPEAAANKPNTIRFNYRFEEEGQPNKYLAFPEIATNQTVAYQSWVNGKLKLARPAVKSSNVEVNLDLTKRAQIIAELGNDYIGNGVNQLVIHNTGNQHNITNLPLTTKSPVQLDFVLMGGYSYIDCHYIALHRSFRTPVNWNNETLTLNWKENLTQSNGVMLTGNQDITGTKKFLSKTFVATGEIGSGGIGFTGDGDSGLYNPRDGVVQIAANNRIAAEFDYTGAANSGTRLFNRQNHVLTLQNDGDLTYRVNDTFLWSAKNSLTKNGGLVAGVLYVQYTADHVGMSARNPTEGKHGYYDIHVGGYNRGGLAIVGNNNTSGQYKAQIRITAPGEVAKDRRTVGMEIAHNEIVTQAYGRLHEAFTRTSTNIIAGNGLTGGGTLAASRTFTLGTPSQITATSTNAVTDTSHTHAIDKASTTRAGIVKLIDNLTTGGTDVALTAEQGKVLAAQIATSVKLTGNQIVNGVKTFTDFPVISEAAGWGALGKTVKGGNWRLEFDPSGADNLRFQFKFRSNDGARESYVLFPKISANESVAYQSWVDSRVAKSIPSGQIAFFAGKTAPTGWLKANGAAVSRTTYAALFAAIGTTYGAGDGTTTFNLPDLRGEFVRGWDDGRNVDSGRAIGSRQSDAIRNITGQFVSDDYNNALVNEMTGAFAMTKRASQVSYDAGSSIATDGSHLHAIKFDAARVVPTASENRPRNLALLACIKI